MKESDLSWYKGVLGNTAHKQRKIKMNEEKLEIVHSKFKNMSVPFIGDGRSMITTLPVACKATGLTARAAYSIMDRNSDEFDGLNCANCGVKTLELLQQHRRLFLVERVRNLITQPDLIMLGIHAHSDRGKEFRKWAQELMLQYAVNTVITEKDQAYKQLEAQFTELRQENTGLKEAMHFLQADYAAFKNQICAALPDLEVQRSNSGRTLQAQKGINLIRNAIN